MAISVSGKKRIGQQQQQQQMEPFEVEVLESVYNEYSNPNSQQMAAVRPRKMASLRFATFSRLIKPSFPIRLFTSATHLPSVILPTSAFCSLTYSSHCPLPSSSHGAGSGISATRFDRSVDADIASANCAIARLSRLGHVSDARQLFDRTAYKDVISWTAMISGYIRSGMLREAQELFDRSDAQKNVVTWTALLSGYFRYRRIREAEEIFQQMPEKNVISWNTMIMGYANNGFVDEAYQIFNRMSERNVVSWNSIIAALAQGGRIVEAYELFGMMPERDVISWTSMVTALSQNGRIDDARAVFDAMPERNVISWNAMISGYTQNSRLVEALDLFQKMPSRDISSWNTMITGFIHNKDLPRAYEFFTMMKERNVVTWTTMMTGYAENGQNEMALKMFTDMLSHHIMPNQGTFVNVLSAISNLAALQEGQQIHQMISKSFYQFDSFVESALMNMYSKCGEIDISRRVFNLSDQKDLVSWNGMIAAYAHHGNGREALMLFSEMQEAGFRANDVTYVGLLSACSHSGLVDEGLRIFELLVNDSSIKLRDNHYACLVDLCGRAGRLKEATRFIKGLKISPSSCVWGALLGGCNVHGDTTIGKLAAKKLIEAEPSNAGSYMLLSNIYASAGKWKEAAKVRTKMKDNGLKKQPGCSWIEVGNSVHVFVVRDKSHSQSRSIYNVLQDLHDKIKTIGYVPSIEDSLADDELVSL